MPLDVSDVDRFANRLTAQAAVIPVRVREVVTATAYLIEGDAKMLAPVDTGALRASISTTIDAGIDEVTAEVGPTVEYGIYQELGTSRMTAQPYLGPAFDRHTPNFLQALEQAANLEVGP